MFTLCNMGDNGRLTAASIKRIIQPIWPKKKDISATDVFYIRLKVNTFLPNLREKPDYDDFKERFNDSVLLNGIDDEVDLDDDMAHELSYDSESSSSVNTDVDSGSD